MKYYNKLNQYTVKFINFSVYKKCNLTGHFYEVIMNTGNI